MSWEIVQAFYILPVYLAGWLMRFIVGKETFNLCSEYFLKFLADNVPDLNRILAFMNC